jgi:hypothetical protein
MHTIKALDRDAALRTAAERRGIVFAEQHRLDADTNHMHNMPYSGHA